MPQGHPHGPGIRKPYNDIGARLIEQGRPDEAVPWLQKAMTAKRCESYSYFNIGRIRERKGEWFGAVEAYRRALAEYPSDALAAQALMN